MYAPINMHTWYLHTNWYRISHNPTMRAKHLVSGLFLPVFPSQRTDAAPWARANFEIRWFSSLSRPVARLLTCLDTKSCSSPWRTWIFPVFCHSPLFSFLTNLLAWSQFPRPALGPQDEAQGQDKTQAQAQALIYTLKNTCMYVYIHIYIYIYIHALFLAILNGFRRLQNEYWPLMYICTCTSCVCMYMYTFFGGGH